MSETQTMPDQSLRLSIGMSCSRPDLPTTVGTRVIPFEIARRFLSDRPLRRPNRNRPLPNSRRSVE